MYNDFIIDFETLGNKPDSIIVDMSILVFNSDPNVMQPFEELISNAKRFKFDIKSQKTSRTSNPSTIKWWKEQVPEAKKNLIASDNDVTCDEAIKGALDFLKSKNINLWKSQGWCRGQSFDFPIFVDLIRNAYDTVETDKYEPIKFWNQRDIRTAIEAYSMVRGMCMTPIRKGVLDGFVKHDSIHDCAKDVIMLKTAQRYAMGLEQVPDEDDIDPQTMKK